MPIKRNQGIADASIERQIITCLIVDEKFCEQIIPILKSNLDYIQVSFARTVAKWCVDYWSKYKKPIRKHIQDEYFDKERKSLSDEDAELIGDFLQGLSREYESGKNLNKDYVLDKTKEYFRHVFLQNLKKQLGLDLKAGRTDKADKLIADYKHKRPDFTTNNDEIFERGFTAKELKEKHTQTITWTIDGIIPAGLTLLAGKSKIGKSFFLLNAAIDLAHGRDAFGAIPTEPSRVLYLALEEPMERTKRRLEAIIGDKEWSDKLHFIPSGACPKADKGGFDFLGNWMKKIP